MSRARPLPPEKRRAAIVEAALPLLEQHGPELTTRMVAEAAGVAEGTLFRAFPTLGELLSATYLEYLSPERLAARLGTIPEEASLEDATSAALASISGYIESVHFALRPPAAKPETGPPQHVKQAMAEFHERFKDLLAWLMATFAPHASELTISPESYSQYLMALSLGRHMGRPAGIEVEQITEFALNGARRRTTA